MPFVVIEFDPRTGSDPHDPMEFWAVFGNRRLKALRLGAPY